MSGRLRQWLFATNGLSFIESALLIGTIGAIALGVYNMLAPSRIQTKVRIATEDIGGIIESVGKYYNVRPIPSNGCPPGTVLTVETGIFPSRMVENGNIVNNAFNSGSISPTAGVFVCGYTPSSSAMLIVRYTSLSDQACARMVTNTSAALASHRLIEIKVKGLTVPLNFNGVVAPPDAANMCRPSGGAVDWYFRLGN